MRPATIGITGGIGSGKSFVCRRLEAEGYKVFYTDAVAKDIIRHDEAVRTMLTAIVGNDLYDIEGKLVKSVMANFITQSKAHAAQIDAIVHARVSERWQQWVETEKAAGSKMPLFMECALLIESGFNALVDKTVLVSAPLSVRIARVIQRDGISEEKVKEWIALQLPEEEKKKRADLCINNDEGMPNLQPLFQLIQSLESNY